jgi:hypothetical protein
MAASANTPPDSYQVPTEPPLLRPSNQITVCEVETVGGIQISNEDPIHAFPVSIDCGYSGTNKQHRAPKGILQVLHAV